MPSLSTELIVLISIAYISLLFLIAYWGDQAEKTGTSTRLFSRRSTLVYSLSLAVYCSSWTFFGAVGSAVRSGWEFFAIYLGPILMFVFGYKLIQRIIVISKQYSITSISDFLSSRFGKSRAVAVLVTLIAVVGSLPYISLQLHAIGMSFNTLSNHSIAANSHAAQSIWTDTAFYGALALAAFGILFGTRHLSATEHHRGMIHAVAFESIVKLIAIMLVGGFAVSLLLNNAEQLAIVNDSGLTGLLRDTQFGTTQTFSWADFTTKLLLSMGAILLLPRQFQVTVVEADSHRPMRTARWLFPLYLGLISIVVVPIALSGVLLTPAHINADQYVLSLPHQHNARTLATFAFIGGLSAATGMVIVASVSLATMICNDVVMPFLLRARRLKLHQRQDLSQLILMVRRLAIISLLLCSYGYYRVSGDNQQLANMGLLSFAAIAQLAPAMIAALYWRRANRAGALWGMGVGFATWGYCLLLPNFIAAPSLDLLFYGSSWLHPQHLFGLDGLSPLTHGVFWSLAFNSAALVAASLKYAPSKLDRIQASIFTLAQLTPKSIDAASAPTPQATVADARLLCESIIGAAGTARLFDQQDTQRQRAGKAALALDEHIDRRLVEAIERAIAGVVGASSARHLITTQLLGESVTAEDLFVMLDETSQVLQFNQDVLQASFENISQGISVIDQELNLVAWNNRYQEMFDYPETLLQIGTPVAQLIRYNAKRGECGEGSVEGHVRRRLRHLHNGTPYAAERQRLDGRHIKINGNPIPGGGFVTSFTDISDEKSQELALRQSEARIRLYTDNLPLMVCYVGRDKKVLFSNKAYDDFIGKSRAEITGLHVDSLFDDTGTAERRNHIERALNGEAVQFRCSRTVSAADEEHKEHYQINYVPYIDTSHDPQATEVDGFFSVYQDITDSVEAAEMLKQTNEALEDRVAERTAELERVTRSKTRFLAAASHDLLQPINAARLFTNALIDRPDNGAQKSTDVLSKIDSSLVSADKLLRALLDISKLDTGTLTPEISHFSVESLMQDLQTELTPLAQDKNLKLVFKPCKLMVTSDRTLLRSIIQNLVTNAIRYTKTGRIVVGCRRSEDSVTLGVYDTGTGIEKDDLPLIFNEFHRIDNSADKEKQGLGLGLAITKRLAEMLGHALAVESEPSIGSAFTIRVPRHHGEVVKLPDTNWRPSTSLAGLKVLYLENARDSLNAMQALVTSWGGELIPCQTYATAIEALKSHPNINVLLADYRLDGIESGLDFLNAAIETRSDSPTTLLITAEQNPHIQQAAEGNGHLFLSKPVEPAALRGILARLARAPNQRAFLSPN